jgi:hypothetical protein
MKKLLLVIIAVMLTSQAFATVGIGVNYVSDYWKFNSETNQAVTLKDNSVAHLTRDAMSNPSGLGVFVVMGVSKYEIEIDGEYTMKKYNVSLNRGGSYGTDSPQLTSSRIGLTGSLKYKFFSIPAVQLYGGVGAGIQLQTPVVGPDLVKDLVADASKQLDVKPADILNKSNKIGFHVMAQVRVKPPAVPLGLMVTMKGIILPSTTFEKPAFVPSLLVGLGFFPF